MRRLAFILLATMLISCQTEKSKFKSPSGYDINNPKTYKMAKELLEISGHAFYQGRSDTIYAEMDEKGAVYTVVPGTDYFKRSVFKKSGDFEDIAIYRDTVIMLKSNGKLYTFPFKALKKDTIDSYKTTKNALPRANYESLYADQETGDIYVLCKECPKDKYTSKVSGYIFNLKKNGKLQLRDEFHINFKKIIEKLEQERIEFKPSALTYNQWTKEWYILASANKLLVTADKDWKIKDVYPLDPKIYIQPEGISFDRDKTLFISSEGSDFRMGRLFKIPYKE